MPDGSRGHRLYLVGVATAGALVLAACLALLARDAPPVPALALAAILAASSYLVLRNLLLFRWRGQPVALGPDEVLVFLALVALPLPLVPLFAAPAMAFFQVQTRRPLLRGAANVAVMLNASAIAALVFLAARSALPPALAALAGIAAYTPATFAQVSVAFALRERANPITVYRERFVAPTALHLALGATGGIVVLGLWAIHPLALLAIAPIALGIRAFARLVARSERETIAHQRLAEVAHALAGEPSLEIVAARVLDAALDILHAGRATITLDAGDGHAGRRWSREAEGGHDPTTRALLAEVIPGPEGPIGAIVVYPSRATQEGFTDADRALLRVVAGGAASYVAHARAIAELEESKKTLLSQRVARPLVRRIVRAVMEESRADIGVLSRLGSGLAREAEAGDLETLCRAYDEMGLGQIQIESTSDRAQYVFTGVDLFERRARSHATTCHIALGFLCGAVSRINKGVPARGSEVTCQSRGDAKCRFIVQARAPDLPIPSSRPSISE